MKFGFDWPSRFREVDLRKWRSYTCRQHRVRQHEAEVILFHMSLVLRKPVFGVSDQVRHKPGCTATEDG